MPRPKYTLPSRLRANQGKRKGGKATFSASMLFLWSWKNTCSPQGNFQIHTKEMLSLGPAVGARQALDSTLLGKCLHLPKSQIPHSSNGGDNTRLVELLWALNGAACVRGLYAPQPALRTPEGRCLAAEPTGAAGWTRRASSQMPLMDPKAWGRSLRLCRSSWLQNEDHNNNSCLLEGIGGIKCDHLHGILRSVPGQDKPSKKKKKQVIIVFLI